jgi:hypothetical protein
LGADRLAGALSCDKVVKGIYFRVEQLEGPLSVDAVFAEGGSLSHGRRLEEIRAIRAAALFAMTRAATAFAHCCPVKAGRGEVRELTAARLFGPGSYCWIDQKCDGKNNDA